MHHMMFFLFLIISPCMAINLSLNEAYTLANHTASRLNLTSPCWICINGRSWGYVQPIPGYQWPTLPAELHAVTQRTPSGRGMPFWEKGEKNFMPMKTDAKMLNNILTKKFFQQCVKSITHHLQVGFTPRMQG